jgi:hypothetical protein
MSLPRNGDVRAPRPRFVRYLLGSLLLQGGDGMRNWIGVSKVLFVLVLVAVVAAGTIAYAAKGGKPKPCKWSDLICMDVWDPVQCDDGKIYSNACYAKRACATGCVPIPGGPVPL